MEASERTAAVFFVGNRLMLDDGVGPAAYDEILAGYDIPENVTLVDVGCMSLDMLPYVERCDVILTVDAVDGTGDAPGTVYRFEPDAMARHSGPEASLHDLKLVDLFDAASLMGYEAEGFCLGMQVGNPSPEQEIAAIPHCLPALIRTQKVQKKMERYYDVFQNDADSYQEAREALDGLKKEEDAGKAGELAGQLLLHLCNLLRLKNISGEQVLTEALEKLLKLYEIV